MSAERRAPETQEEWMIHSINIHGSFFEAWCRDIVSRVSGWSLAYYHYPVEWPEFNGFVRGHESSLDLRADWRSGNDRVALLIECKQRNPDLTEWVFFRQRGIYTATPTPAFQLNLNVDAAGRVTVDHGVTGPFPWTSVVADGGRETRGDYVAYKKGDKTRTTSHAIDDAARQVCLAYRAIVREKGRTAARTIPVSLIPFQVRRQFFVGASAPFVASGGASW
jgi:hypothetical protein